MRWDATVVARRVADESIAVRVVNMERGSEIGEGYLWEGLEYY